MVDRYVTGHAYEGAMHPVDDQPEAVEGLGGKSF